MSIQRAGGRAWRGRWKGLALAAIATATLTLAGCGISIPADPDGTLDRVRGGELRVGVSPNGEFVNVEPDAGGDPTGNEVEAISAFAESIDARPVWTTGSEESLVRSLEDGGLDIIAGGLTEDTPWSDRAGVTRPYAEVAEGDEAVKIVMLVPRGENAFLSQLETFLSAYVAEDER